MAAGRGYGRKRTVVKGGGGTSIARNTELQLFRAKKNHLYVGLLGNWEAAWLHLVYNGIRQSTGKTKRRNFPCAKSPIFDPNKQDTGDEISKSEDPCLLCDLADTDNAKCWWPDAHYASYWILLGEMTELDGDPAGDQQVMIWSRPDTVQEDLETIRNLTPIGQKDATQVLVRAKPREKYIDLKLSKWDGDEVELSQEVIAAYKVAKKAKALQAFAKPPTNDELKELMDAHWKAIEGGQDEIRGGGGSKGKEGLEDEEAGAEPVEAGTTAKPGKLDDKAIDSLLDDDDENE